MKNLTDAIVEEYSKLDGARLEINTDGVMTQVSLKIKNRDVKYLAMQRFEGSSSGYLYTRNLTIGPEYNKEVFDFIINSHSNIAKIIGSKKIISDAWNNNDKAWYIDNGYKFENSPYVGVKKV